MVDALKSLMSTMADAVTRRVSEQVKRTIEATSSARPPVAFEYPLVHEGEPSHRSGTIPSPRPTERGRGVSQSDQSGRLSTGGHPMLRRPPPMITPPRPQNTRKYCEFYEQSGHAMTECRELKKALHELADKGQIDRFLKKGPRLRRQGQEPAPPPPWDEEWTTRRALHHPHAPLPQKHQLQLLGGWWPRPRDKLNLLRVAALRGDPLLLVHKVKIGLEILVIFKLATRVSTTLRSGLADSPAPWLRPHRSWPSPADAVVLSSRSHGPPGEPCRWSREMSASSCWHSETAFIPRAKTSAIAISSSVTLGDLKPQELPSPRI
ncbi:hypothetical protein Cgig2_010660 [Carnegiea gigantea]|uniref:Retrotransposon gag domain-containing protein n=1 Tax=Carnegiea gigantea TaxID=171969 RepID=A0A9Q1JL62_9CARY|nr:hypothetical protein Cgig2_010660 [Carnegiea gigantea]